MIINKRDEDNYNCEEVGWTKSVKTQVYWATMINKCDEDNYNYDDFGDKADMIFLELPSAPNNVSM